MAHTHILPFGKTIQATQEKHKKQQREKKNARKHIRNKPLDKINSKGRFLVFIVLCVRVLLAFLHEKCRIKSL